MKNITTQNRDISALNSMVQAMLKLALTDIKAQGVNPLIVETYRTQERQNYLYCQGRTIAEAVEKGINSRFAKAYCTPSVTKVTWTLNSVHNTKKAIDIVPQRKLNGVMTAIWNANDAQTKIIIKTMQKYGFEAGAYWSKNADSSHFQVKGNFSTLFSKDKNTIYVTKAIQTALNKKVKANLTVDGNWGSNTVNAVNKYRKQQGYNLANGVIGKEVYKTLFS